MGCNLGNILHGLKPSLKQTKYDTMVNMKKTLTLTSIISASLILAGCTAPPAANFDNNVKLSSVPVWDLSKNVGDIENAYKVPESTQSPTPPPSALESAEKLVENQKVEGKPAGDPSPEATEPPSQEPVDGAEIINASPTNGNVYSDTYIANFDTETSCKITGQIAYLESYKASWGEEYNAKTYLYNIIAPSEKTLANEKKININGTDYVFGTYTQPLSYGERPYHMSAARAFSTVFPIPNSTNEMAGPYQSKTNEGIPFVFIDMSCVDEKEATQETWERMTDIFHLSYGVQK